MATIVYEYGLLDPIEGVETLFEQIRRKHAYYNKKIEIERDRRATYRQIMSSVGDIAALEENLATIDQEIIEAKATVAATKGRQRNGRVDPELQQRIKTLAAQAKTQRLLIRNVKAQEKLDPEIAARIKASNKSAKAQQNAARTEARRRRDDVPGVYWGTYRIAENAFNDAKKAKPVPRPGKKPKIRPKFKYWTGESSVAVQFQKGEPVDDLLGGDTRAQILSLPDSPNTKPGSRRAGQRKLLRLRVASDKKKRPIWGVWPMIMHRPFPEGARAIWAKVFLRKHANRERWCVQITLSVPDRVARPLEVGESPRFVGIDVGWRKIDDHAIRYAYWAGSDGQRGEAQLDLPPKRTTVKARYQKSVPMSVRDRLEKADAIQSTRGKLQDTMQKALVPQLKSLPLSEALRTRIETIAYWESPAQFAALTFAWRNDRCEGDMQAYTLLAAWQERDRHLWQYETGLRRGALAHRREVYRLLAVKLARRYDVAVLEKFDLRDVAKREEVEDGSRDKRKPNHQRQMTGISIFRLALKSTFDREGGQVVTTPAPFTTLDHACKDQTVWNTACGYRNTWDTASSIMQICGGCGEKVDQDEIAADNLLASGPVALKEAEALAALNALKPKKKRFGDKRKKSAPALASQRLLDSF